MLYRSDVEHSLYLTTLYFCLNNVKRLGLLIKLFMSQSENGVEKQKKWGNMPKQLGFWLKFVKKAFCKLGQAVGGGAT